MSHVGFGALIIGGFSAILLMQRVGTEAFIDRVLGYLVVVLFVVGILRIMKAVD